MARGLLLQVIVLFSVRSQIRGFFLLRPCCSSIIRPLTVVSTGILHHHHHQQQQQQHESLAPMLSWRQRLDESSTKTQEIRGSNYVQLATVDPDTLEPRCRTIVFRGFLDLSQQQQDHHHPCAILCDTMSCLMQMTTDARSAKVGHIQAFHSQHPSRPAIGELVWWFPTLSEQYRIRGELILVGDCTTGRFEYDQDTELAKARILQWEKLGETMQVSFLAKDSSLLNNGGDDDDDDDIEQQQRPLSSSVAATPAATTSCPRPVPAHFLLMLLKPYHVDYLRLADMYRQIDIRSPSSSTSWTKERVNP